MIIKYTTILISIVLSLCISANAQEGLYRFRCENGESLESALKAFGQENGIQFGYPSYIFDQIYPGQLDLSHAELDELLMQVLSPSQIEYTRLDDGKILLRKPHEKELSKLNTRNTKIRGQIIDGLTSEPLEYAAIAIPKLNVGTYTDSDGGFELDVRSDALEEHMLITYIGYEAKRMSVKEFYKNSSISLKSSNQEIEEIIVESSKPIVVVNQLAPNTALKINDLLNIGVNAVQTDDLLRKLQYLPGIGAADDKSSSIRIRGADESETLVMIDGIPIYKTDHFYGVFSNVNGSYIDDVTLYKNEMPINYSGKSGGLVTMKSADRIEDFSGAFSIDLLNSSLSIGYPISDHWSLKLAGRAAYDEVTNKGFFDTDETIEFFNSGTVNFNRPTVLGVTPSFDFYDVNAKVSFVDERLSFSANYFRSLDNLDSYFENSFSSRGPNRTRVTNEENFSNLESWKNNGASLNFKLKLPNDFILTSNSYYTEFSDSGTLEFSISNDHPSRPLDNSVRNGRENQVKDIGTVLMGSKNIGSTSVNLGGHFVHHDNSITIGEDETSILRNEKSSIEVGGFGSVTHRIEDRLSLSGGLRATYYDQTEEIYISPQLSVSYLIDAYSSLKSSYSINYQYVREVSYTSRFGEEIELFTLSDDNRFPVGQSTNYMIGGTYKKDNWLLDMELYRVDRDQVLGFTTYLPRLINNTNPNDQNRNYRILNGEGYTNGMDVLLSYQSKGYKGLLSYTLSKSENNFNEVYRNEPFPTQDDRRHQLSMTNTYSYQSFDFSVNAVYASGRIFTDLRLLQEGQDRQNNNPGSFIQRLPDYMRFDLGAAYNFDLFGRDAKVELSVLNILNRQNVKYLQFTALIPVENDQNNNSLRQEVLGTQTNQLDRTVNLSFGIKF